MGPGDLVVCVNVGFIAGSLNIDLDLLSVGDVYTIKDIDKSDTSRSGLRVKLLEVDSPPPDWWNPDRFRPCRNTDIGSLEFLTKECEIV